MRPSPFATRVFVTLLPMAFIGTMLHEAGHIGVARALGYTTTLHYGSMTYDAADWDAVVDFESDALWISLGGPLTNMGLGVVGLLWLARLSRRGRVGFQGWGVPAVLLALFWSRQLFNGAVALAKELRGLSWANGDEAKIANTYGWPQGSLLGATALLAVLAILRTVFYLPREQRRPFVAAGGAGALLGYLAWYGILGPLLLP